MNISTSHDVYDAEKRAAVMRAVKGKNTKPEITLRKALFARGFRYRLNVKDLPGKPDLVFPKYRAAIFVNGCFWHGHDCKRGARTPKTNRDYWIAKIARNQERDKAALSALAELGWRTLTIWECELRDLEDAATRAEAFLQTR